MPAAEPVAVFVYATDPVLHAGIAALAEGSTGLRVVGPDQLDAARVAVVAADRLDPATVRVVRAVQRDGCPRVVVVVSDADDRSLLDALDAGAASVLRRAQVNREVLAAAVLAAASGEGAIAAGLVGRLLAQARGSAPAGRAGLLALNEREHAVLRLLAEGFDTTEVARRLSWSERTVKNVVQAVTNRHQLRNRTHAVAYALRHGLI